MVSLTFRYFVVGEVGINGFCFDVALFLIQATNIPRLSLFCLLVACISYFFLVVSATNMKPSVNRQADSLAGRLQPSSSSLEKGK